MGIALIFFSLVLYLTGVPRDNYIQYLSYVIMIVLTIVFVKQWRVKHNDGYLTYRQAFSHGFLIILFATILSALYTYVFFAFIAPEELQVILQEAEDKMYDQNMPDEQIAIAMKWTAMMTKPWVMSIWVIIGGTIGGLLISAVLAIFLKKESTEFE